MCNGKVPHGCALSGELSRRSFMRGAASIGSALLDTQLSTPRRGATTRNQEDQHPTSKAGQPDKADGYILDLEQGLAIGNHRIKADPEMGSMRLGLGLQRFAAGEGIGLHRHMKEDEILFIHSGTALGVVGHTVKPVRSGATIYIPAGVWHGIRSEGSELAVVWVVSPPHFAQQLRELHSGRPVTREQLSWQSPAPPPSLVEIVRKHGFQDARYFAAQNLANTKWRGDATWGEVVFDTVGTRATYHGVTGTGRIAIQYDAPEGLDFIGEHSQPDGSKTPIELRFDYATGVRIVVNWGPQFRRESTWVKITNTGNHE